MKYRAQKRGAIFQTVPSRKIPKSGFPLSYCNSFTTDIGRLTPIMCQDVIPGDTFRLKDVIMTRFLPMLSPVMGRINCTVRYFFVPERLLWNKFGEFITGGPEGTSEPVKPQVDLYDLNENYKCGIKSLYDYLGGGFASSFASDGSNNMDLGPFTAYNLIYQEYYRDQNLGEDLSEVLEYVRNKEGELDLEEEFGDDNKTLLSEKFFDVRQKCWKKDYFTSALPWAQRGPAVTIPIGTSAPVTLNNQNVQFGLLSGSTWNISNINGDTGKLYENILSGNRATNIGMFLDNVPSEDSASDISTLRGVLKTDQNTNLKGVADLSQVTGITINDLRLLARTQTWYERNAVGGGRYNEQTLSHWDEIVPDFTVQRPVYLGGATFPVQVSEVLQTAQITDSGTSSSTAAGVGNMYGHGIGVSGKPGFRKFHFSEWGWIIGLCSFMPEVSYFQGLPRKFTRFDKFDYAWNELAHLGEQEILNKEIYITNSNQNKTFGYQSRYAEYKYNQDEIHGDFRNSLLYWTLARKFDNVPALNNTFMKVDANVVSRIFAVQDGTFDHILCMLYHDMPASRKLPKYGTPGLHII